MPNKLPFSPGDPAPRGRRARGGDDTPLRVSELAALIEQALRSGIPGQVRVRGEIGSLSQRGHWYFNLKDGDAVIGCAMWKSRARSVGFEVGEGVEVVATGSVDLYKPQGRLSLIVDRLERVGLGSLEVELRTRVEQARGLGWLEPERKRELPSFPRRLAVVTSAGGAAVQDVIDTCARRCPAVGLLVVDVRVQGDGAAEQVANAVSAVSAQHERLGVDAVIVTRGGGSMEDLWCFNEWAVAEAVVGCSVPVVCAIGHETDTTLVELVADERCATPTQAAMRLTPDRVEMARQVSAIEGRLGHAVRSRVRLGVERVARAGRRPVMLSPARLVDAHRERAVRAGERLLAAVRRRVSIERGRAADLSLRLERRRPAAEQARRSERVSQLAERLGRVARRVVARDLERLAAARRDLRVSAASRLEREGARLVAAARELHAVSPQAVLERGFTVTTDASGRAVRGPEDVSAGDRVTTRTAGGSFGSVVEGVGEPESHTEREPAPVRPPVKRVRRGRGRAGGGRDQLDLFGGGG